MALCDPDFVDADGEYYAIVMEKQGSDYAWKLVAKTQNQWGTNLARSDAITGTANKHHVCAVFRSTTHREIYLDGKSLASGADARALTGVIDELVIGTVIRNGTAWTNSWYGKIADSRVYDYALSAAEVHSLHANPWELYRPLVPYVMGLAPAAPGGLSIPVARHHYRQMRTS
jgi:hypothetical protein